ncbi:hypothetical protein [Streptomyces sp. NPDC004324]
MTPLERLLVESIPTRPAPPQDPAPRTAWTPEQQAAHRADLLEALHNWHWTDDTSLSTQRRHLRLIRQTEAA